MQAGHDLARRGNVERRGKEAASDCRQPAQLPAWTADGVAAKYFFATLAMASVVTPRMPLMV